MEICSISARGFTLAVFLKETSSNDVDKMEWIGGIVILCVGILLNIVTFRHCGQDWTRSIVFGLSSTLIPAGYNNDEYFYQVKWVRGFISKCQHENLIGREPVSTN